MGLHPLSPHRPGSARRIAVLAALGAGLATLPISLLPASAPADGDPASDVLLGTNVFYPYSPPVSATLQRELDATTATAGRHGFPIKVALIAGPTDLGVIPELFGKPQQYAAFLDQEISFSGRPAPLLVVMPDGYGVRGLGPGATRAARSLARPSGAQSNALAQAAVLAVGRLAAAAGHRLGPGTSQPAPSPGGGGSALPAVILGAVAVALAGAVLAYRGRRARRP